MPAKITVGMTRKLGLPQYSSVGAGCEVTFHAPDPMADPQGFAERVHRAFNACDIAVRAELARRRSMNGPVEEAPEAVGPAPHQSAKSNDSFPIKRR